MNKAMIIFNILVMHAKLSGGGPPEKVLNNAQVIWDLIHPEDIKKMTSSIQHSANNMSKWECGWRITPHNSTDTKWLRGYGTPRKGEGGVITWNSPNSTLKCDTLSKIKQPPSFL